MNENFFNKIPQTTNLEKEERKSEVKIEVATPEEWEAVRDLRLLSISGQDKEMFGSDIKNFEKEKAKTEEEWKNDMSEDKGFFMLLKENSKDIGIIRASRGLEDKVWYLRWAYIEDNTEFRGKGLGKELYEAPINKIKELGGEKIIAFIRNNNKKSIHIAETIGFKKITNPFKIISSLGYNPNILLRWRILEKDLVK